MALLSNICPVCVKAPIFTGIYAMNQRCPACGHEYVRESGYFVGAMMAAYFFGIISVIPTLLIALFALECGLGLSIGIAAAQLTLMQPFLFRYSRIFWIQFETKLSRKL